VVEFDPERQAKHPLGLDPKRVPDFDPDVDSSSSEENATKQ
jgi:hypothetical protein